MIFAFNTLNTFNTKKNVRNLYLLSQLELKSDFDQQFKTGHLSLAYEIPTCHKSTTSNSNTFCGGWGKKCNKQFIRLFLINYREIIHACPKAFI